MNKFISLIGVCLCLSSVTLFAQNGTHFIQTTGINARFPMLLGNDDTLNLQRTDTEVEYIVAIIETNGCAWFDNNSTEFIWAPGTSKISLPIHTCGAEYFAHLSLMPKNDIGSVSEPKSMAPVTVSTSITPSQLVNNYFVGGGCVQISNISYTGAPTARGIFSGGGASIGFNSGILLTTGNANLTVPGPNDDGSFSGGFDNFGSDANLNSLSGGTKYDVAKLEFDFIPLTSTVSFNYVFASEEYCDYINSNYNDVFGFFISGPGIPGGIQNIATLPNGTAVSINNVNHTTNAAVYNSNTQSGHPDYIDNSCNGHPVASGAGPNDLQFDGYTDVLTATTNVIPCETYHIKLVISDVGDGGWDSGVFLKGNSFDAGGKVLTEILYDSGANAVEGCSDGLLHVFRVPGSSTSDPVTVNVILSGTATNGADYNGIPTTFTLAAGISDAYFPFNALLDGIAEGTETVIITYDNPCDCNNQSDTIFIVDPQPLLVNMPNGQACPNGTAILSPSVTSGTGPYSYLWSNGTSGATLSVPGSSGGTYTVTVSNSCGQTATASAQVVIGAAPTASMSGSISICTAGQAASIPITFTGAGPYEFTYTINGGAPQTATANSSPFNLPASVTGTYTLTSVQQVGGGCPGTATGTATVSNNILDGSASATNAGCGSSGTVTANASGAGAPFSFAWSNGNSSSSQSGLAAGTYTVTISATTGCSTVSTVTISNATPLSVSVNSSGDQNCQSGGFIDILVAGGVAPYSYAWSGGLAGSEDQGGLSPGIYEVTVTDAGGCSGTASANIATSQNYPTVVPGPGDTMGCVPTTIQLSATATGTGFLSYQWSGGGIVSGGSTLTPMVNAPGTYIITVTDTQSACSVTASVVVAQNITPPDVTIPPPPPLTCTVNQVTIDASVLGENYVYNWSTPSGNIVSGEDTATPLVDAQGNYFLEVTDPDNGCKSSLSVAVTVDLTLPEIDLDKTGNLTCDLTLVNLQANVIFNGPVSYQWSTTNGNIVGASNTASINVNDAGIYIVTVTPFGNELCSAFKQIIVSGDTLEPIANAGIDATLNCVINTITLNGQVSGTPNISWSWQTPDGNIVSGGNGLQPVVNQAGMYILTATNTVNDCIDKDTVIINTDTTLPLANAGTNPTLSCIQSSVILSNSGSSTGPEYTYTWTTPSFSTLNGGTQTVNIAGEYSLSVTNIQNGCVATDQVTVLNNISLPELVSDTLSITCQQNTLNLQVTSTALLSSYTWQWQASAGGALTNPPTQATQTVVSSGMYSVTATNTSNGCTATAFVKVIQDTSLPVVSINPPSVWECSTVSQTLQGSVTGVGPYTYVWTTSNGGFVAPSTSDTIQINMPGSYTLQAINTTNGCQVQTSVNIPVDTIHPLVSINTLQFGCATSSGLLQGQITNNDGGLYSIYWFSIDGGVGIDSTSLSPTIDFSGAFTLTVTDQENGCQGIATTIVTSNYDPPSIAIEAPQVITCSNPIVPVIGSLNTPLPNVAWTWTGPNGTSIVSGLGTPNLTVQDTGVYNLTVVNLDNGCFRSDTVHVTSDLTPPLAIILPPAELTCTATSVALDGSTSVGNALSYNWSTTNGTITSDTTLSSVTVSLSGTYSLTVTNGSNGCSDQTTTSVAQNYVPPSLSINPPNILTCVTTTIEINAQTQAGAILQWTNQSGLPIGNNADLNVSTPGEYTLTITDPITGCQNNQSVTVLQNIEAPIVDAGVDTILNCLVTNIQLSGSANASSGILQYSWSNINGNTIINDATATPIIQTNGTYTLLVTNTSNGCTAIDEVNVAIDTISPIINIATPQDLTCTVLSVELLASTNLSSNYVINWSGPLGGISENGNTLQPSVVLPGVYSLNIQNQDNFCNSTLSTNVNQNIVPPVAIIALPDTLTCVLLAVNVEGNNSVGNALSYNWATTNGQIIGSNITNFITTDQIGTYTLTVTDGVNGCTHTATQTVVSDLDVPTPSIFTPAILTCTTQQVTLQSQLSDATPVTYQWSNALGANLGNAATQIVSTPGTYTLNIENPATGCTVSTSVLVLQDLAQPLVDAGAGSTLTCTTTQLNLSGSASATGASVNYNWTTVNGNILAGANTALPTINAAGSYTLTATNTFNGCTNFDVVSISIDTTHPVIVIPQPAELTCTYLVVTLNASLSSVQAYQLSWTGPTNGIVNGENTLQPSVAVPGNYTLTINNNVNGCVTTKTTVVSQDTVPPTAEAGAPDSLTCLYVTLLLNGAAYNYGTADIKYDWTTQNGNILYGGTSPSPTINQPGIYTLTITNLDNGCFNDDWVLIGIDTVLPEIVVLPPAILTCYEPEIAINGNASSTGPQYAYTWTTANGNILSGANTLSPVVDEPGNYNLQVENTNNGCKEYKDVLVDQNIALAYVNAGPDQIIPCINPFVTLEGDTIGTQVSFDWVADNSQELPYGQLQPTVALAGTYILEVTNLINGCINRDTTLATYAPHPQPFINVQSPNCNQTTGQILIDSVVGGTPPFVHSVNTGPFYPAIVYTLLLPGMYSVVTQDAEGCTGTSILSIEEPPVFEVSIQASANSLSLGDTLELAAYTSLPVDSIASVLWSSPQTPVACDTCFATYAVPQNNSIFFVTFTDLTGCQVAAALTIPVDTIPTIWFPNAFTPNGDGENDFFFPFASSGDAKIKEVHLLQIFDRWGTMHFENRDFQPDQPEYGWDGTFRGLPQNPAVFVWQAEVVLVNGKRIFMNGDVTLLR